MTDFDANNTVEACKRFERIEPFQLNDITERAINLTALMSIAISLKRIADSMEKSEKHLSVIKNTIGIE